MVGVIDRCPTGIPGFDQISRGGFVRNSDNLIIGGPGSGKTTFLLQFLWNGVTQFNENGLYISFEPDIVDILNDAMAYGWDFTKLSNEGKIKFMKFAPETSVDELRSQLRKIIARNNIRRICFDPISILAMNLGDQGKARKRVFELSSLMKRLRVTTLYADESMESEGIERHVEGGWTKTDILRFLSDSVTIIYDYSITGVGDRALRILKMRRTAHERKVTGMEIKEYGIDVEYDDKQPSYRESYPVVEPSSLVFGEDPLKLTNVPISNPSSVNSVSGIEESTKKEVKGSGIGTVPTLSDSKISREKVPISTDESKPVSPRVQGPPVVVKPFKQKVQQTKNENVLKQKVLVNVSEGKNFNRVSYSPASIPPGPLRTSQNMPNPILNPSQIKKEQTVFRAKSPDAKLLQKSQQLIEGKASNSSVKPLVKSPVSQEDKKVAEKVDWID